MAQSTIESRCSSYVHELNSMTGEEASETEMEIREREMEALEDQEKAANKEAIALTDGLIVWQDSCETVNDLERQLTLLPKQERANSKKIATMLNQTLERLERNFHIAEDNKWSLLTVGIGQEVEALRQGIEIVESQISTSQRFGSMSTTGSSPINSASVAQGFTSTPTAATQILSKLTLKSPISESTNLHPISITPKQSQSSSSSFSGIGRSPTISNINSESASAPTPAPSNKFSSAVQVLGTIGGKELTTNSQEHSSA